MTCCFINYYISWYCIFLFTNSIVNNTGIWFYTSIVNNTGIPVLWSPSTGDPIQDVYKVLLLNVQYIKKMSTFFIKPKSCQLPVPGMRSILILFYLHTLKKLEYYNNKINHEILWNRHCMARGSDNFFSLS